MTKLQLLITESLESGKSYRRIGEECKINHVSITRYHKGKSTPNGKNLAILEKYYHTPLEDLVEQVKGYVLNPAVATETDYGRVLLEEECADLSPDERLQVTLELRKWKREMRQN